MGCPEARGEQRIRGHRPTPRSRAGQIEPPHITQQVAGVHVVDGVVSIEIGWSDIGNAVAACLAGAQVIKGHGPVVRIHEHHKNTGIAGRAAEAIAEYRTPAAVVKAADLRYAVGIAQILGTTGRRCAGHVDAGNRIVGPLALDDVRGIAFREGVVGIGDIEGIDRLATGAEAADQPGVPGVAVKQIAGSGRRIHVVFMAVLRIREIQYGVVHGRRAAGGGLNGPCDMPRHEGQYFRAVVIRFDVVVAAVVVARPEAVQEAVVGAGVYHVGAGLEAAARARREHRVLGGAAGVLSQRIARGMQSVGPGRRIGRRRRPDPGRAGIDDVAEHAGAVAEHAVESGGGGGGLFIAAITAQVVEPRIGERRRRRGNSITRVQRSLFGRCEIGPLERNSGRTIPAHHGAAGARPGLRRDCARRAVGRIALSCCGAGQYTGRVPCNGRIDAQQIGIGRILVEILRGQGPGQGGGVVEREVHLGADLHLGGLLLVEAGRTL